MGDPDHREERNRADSGFLVLGMRYAGIASQFALTLAILGYLGNQADERYGLAPWGVLAGILSGMTLGLISMIKQLNKLEKDRISKNRKK